MKKLIEKYRSMKLWKRILSATLALLVLGSALYFGGVEIREAYSESIRKPVDSFTKEDNLRVLFESEEMGDFAYFFISRSERYARKLKDQSLADLNAGEASWNADSMEYGLQHMLDIIHSGVKVDYDFYTEEERKADPSKEKTKLFYFPGEENAPYVLLCAGGGFTSVCNMVEAFPVAAKLNELGFNVFCLSYRTAAASLNVDFDAAATVALEDVARALEYINENADIFCVSTDNYAVGGFSAGSALVANWCVEEKGWGKYEASKPACAFLVYGSVDLEEVTESYPAAYLVYCMDDPVVDPASMSNLAAKLDSMGIPCVNHAGQTGGHGFGLGLDTDVEGWVEEAVGFWQGLNP